jgi:hypothetical protein
VLKAFAGRHIQANASCGAKQQHPSFASKVGGVGNSRGEMFEQHVGKLLLVSKTSE